MHSCCLEAMRNLCPSVESDSRNLYKRVPTLGNAFLCVFPPLQAGVFSLVIRIARTMLMKKTQHTHTHTHTHTQTDPSFAFWQPRAFALWSSCYCGTVPRLTSEESVFAFSPLNLKAD